MQKYLNFTFSDQSTWRIPVQVIFEHRVGYLQSLKTYSDQDAYSETIERFEKHPHEIIAHVFSFMRWSDFKTVAVQVEVPVRPDYEKEFIFSRPQFFEDTHNA